MVTLPRHVFLTGDPGIGKSTIIQKVLRRLGKSTEYIGFYTKENLGLDGDRIGFTSIDVADACHSAQIATLHGGVSSQKIGPFSVCVDRLQGFVATCLQRLVDGQLEEVHTKLLVVLDEIGAMQLLSSHVQLLLGIALGDEHSLGNPCLGTLPSPGLHDLPFVEAIRRRNDVLVFTVTEHNRESLVDDVWSLIRRQLFSPELDSQIRSKAELAQRYLGDLQGRLEGSICRDACINFRGDHGVYSITSCSTQWRVCSCPFFRDHGTCSHTLALTFCEEL